MLRFICYADGEDLTPKVRAITGNNVEGALRTRTIRVVCSKDHPNIFGRFSDPNIPVADAQKAGNSTTIDLPGRPPTPGEELLSEAAQRLAPGSSIDRLESHAKFILGNVGVVGTAMTALGLLQFPRLSWWIVAPAALAALSLACAAVALTPKYSTVEVSDLGKVQRYYVDLLSGRGAWVRAAGILFALAFLTAPLAFLCPPAASVTSDTTLKITRAEDQSDVASVTISLVNVSPQSAVQAELFLDEQVTAFATYSRDAGSDVKLSFEHPIPRAKQVRVLTTVCRGGAKVYTEESRADVPLPPEQKAKEEEAQQPLG